MRLGVLGTANANLHVLLRFLAARPDVDLVGISDLVQARAEALGAELGIRPFTEVRALLAERLDAGLVCADTTSRPALIQMAAGAVPHLLCDVPLAPTMEAAAAALATYEAEDGMLQPALYLRFAPVLHTLKQVLDERRLGRILSVKVIYHGKRSANLPDTDVLLGRGLHIVDALRWLLKDEITEVYAQAGTALFGGDPGQQDGGLLSLTMAGGAYATADVSLALPEAYPARETLKFEIIGDAGSIRVDAFRQHVDLHTTSTRWVNWGSDPQIEMLRAFLEDAAASRPPSVTGQDALRAQAAIMAALQSCSSGAPVRL